MKKILPIVLLSFILCFSMAGCGGGNDKSPEPEEELKATSIEGSWKCVDMSMVDGDSTYGKEDLEELYGAKAKDVAALTAYGDGSGEFTYMGNTGAVTWTESEEGYDIDLGDGQVMKAELKDNTLTLTSEDSYMSDDTEIKMVVTYTLEYQGKTSKFFNDWNLALTDDEIREMSNYMAYGHYVVADGYLYGDFGGKKETSHIVSMAEIKMGNEPELGKVKTIEDDGWAAYLTEHDGYIYGTISDSKIIKIKVGEAKYDTIYDKTANSLQIVGNKIYFTDENAYLCTMSLDGKNIKTVLDKAVYYPYVLPNNTVIYQDDADGESLHIYSLKEKEDVKINSVVSYVPIISGDYVYYFTPSGEEFYHLERVDLYSGKVETAPDELEYLNYFIEDGEITFGFGGMPSVSMDEWDKLGTKNYGGFTITPEYSNGELRVFSEPSGAIYAACDTFKSRKGTIELGFYY